MRKSKNKILIADDNSQNLYLLETLLKSNGYEVITARNGKEALELSKKEIPDIVISDILMPVMDGFELCRIHKSDDNLKKIPFIIYTATYTDQKDEELALSLGADKFIIKPQKPDFLIDIISKTLKINASKTNPSAYKHYNENGEFLKQYNNVLFNKLEKKVKQLENEIETRKKTEEEIKKVLNEKEFLINELFHRSKNNMQLILSIIDIQANYFENTEIKSVLFNLENRIHSMALAYNILIQYKEFSKINLKKYISDLSVFLTERFNMHNNKIKLDLSGLEDIFIFIDTAIPCGLIINELITNSLKHAFPENASGEIKIILRKKSADLVELIISDNGIGFKDNFDLKKHAKMGIKTIHDIGEKQLKGKVEYGNVKGTACTFTFKINNSLNVE